MRKLLYWLLALLAAHTAGWAQAIRPAGDTTSLNQDLRAACSTLNPSRTSTGILLNQVAAVSGWHDFSGTGTPKTNSTPTGGSSTTSTTGPASTKTAGPRSTP